MQILIKTLLIILTIFLSILLFLPKKEFYFQIEKELSKYNLFISEEKIKDNFFNLNLSDGKVYFKDSQAAFFKNIKFTPYLLSNKIEIKNFEPDNSIQSIIPAKLNFAKASYSIFFPTQVDIYIESDFGSAKGYFDISKNSLKLYITSNKSEAFNSIKRYLKNTKEGWVYEKSF